MLTLILEKSWTKAIWDKDENEFTGWLSISECGDVSSHSCDIKRVCDKPIYEKINVGTDTIAVVSALGNRFRSPYWFICLPEFGGKMPDVVFCHAATELLNPLAPLPPDQVSAIQRNIDGENSLEFKLVRYSYGGGSGAFVDVGTFIGDLAQAVKDKDSTRVKTLLKHLENACAISGLKDRQAAGADNSHPQSDATRRMADALMFVVIGCLRERISEEILAFTLAHEAGDSYSLDGLKERLWKDGEGLVPMVKKYSNILPENSNINATLTKIKGLAPNSTEDLRKSIGDKGNIKEIMGLIDEFVVVFTGKS